MCALLHLDYVHAETVRGKQTKASNVSKAAVGRSGTLQYFSTYQSDLNVDH